MSLTDRSTDTSPKHTMRFAYASRGKICFWWQYNLKTCTIHYTSLTDRLSYAETVPRYGDGAGNSVEDNSSVF